MLILLPDIEELDRQKQQLSRKIRNLSIRADQQAEMGEKNNMRRIGENSMLIADLNDMRKLNKSYQDKIRSLEQQIKSLKHQEESGTASIGASPASTLGNKTITRNSSSTTKMPALGQSKNNQLPNAKAQAQLQQYAVADGFPLTITAQHKPPK